MPDFRRFPSPIRELGEAASEGRGAILLEGNTLDWWLEPGVGLPAPMLLLHACATAFAREGYRVGHLSLSRGFEEVKPPGAPELGGPSPFPRVAGRPWEHPAEAVASLVPVLQRADPPVLVVLSGADFALPESETASLGPEALQLLDLLIELGSSATFRRTGNVLVLLSTQGPIHRGLLRSGAFRRVLAPLPDDAMRRAFFSLLAAQPRYAKLFVPADHAALVQAANGCRLADLDGLVRRLASHGLPLTPAALQPVRRQTLLDLSDGQLGVRIPQTTLEDLVGLPHVRRFVQYQAQLAAAGSPAMPGMVLFVGVPGVGKTFSIDAYAHALGWTLLEWRNVRGPFVGQSEERTERALQLIRQYAPCLVFVDECDQMLGRRSTGPSESGVDGRIFGTILAATGDASLRGKVQWLLLTNRPDAIDVALRDRAGEQLVYLTPTIAERRLLLPRLAATHGRAWDVGSVAEELAAAPSLATASVRNLNDLIARAGRHADTAAHRLASPITADALTRSIESFEPDDPDEVAFLALQALAHLRFRDQLPWLNDDGRVNEPLELPPYLDGLVDVTTGRLLQDRLTARLADLATTRAHRRWTA